MIKMRVLALLAVMVMVLMVPAVASAQQVPPHIFIGTVTVNGLAAPAGTAVFAVIDGVEQGSTTVTAGGGYVLHVSQGRGASGTLVTVRGEGFRTFETVTTVEFGGRGTLGGRTVNTDANGNFEILDVVVPALTPVSTRSRWR